MQDYGINAYPVRKGADSIMYGIQLMQEQNYFITKNSTNLINELQKYTWAIDKRTGNKTNKPIESFNHLIDGFRYHEMETLGMNKNYGSYSIL